MERAQQTQQQLEPVMFSVVPLDTEQPGTYWLGVDLPAYAVITERRYSQLHVLKIKLPKGALISVTRDRKRKYGRKYRIRTNLLQVLSIFNSAHHVDLNALPFRDAMLRPGETYEFDFFKNQIFIVPTFHEVTKIIAYVSRYKCDGDEI